MTGRLSELIATSLVERERSWWHSRKVWMRPWANWSSRQWTKWTTNNITSTAQYTSVRTNVLISVKDTLFYTSTSMWERQYNCTPPPVVYEDVLSLGLPVDVAPERVRCGNVLQFWHLAFWNSDQNPMEKLAAEIAHNMEACRETKPLQTEIQNEILRHQTFKFLGASCENLLSSQSPLWRKHGFVAEELWLQSSKCGCDCWKEQLASGSWLVGGLRLVEKNGKIFPGKTSPGPELMEIRHPGAVRTVGAASSVADLPRHDPHPV